MLLVIHQTTVKFFILVDLKVKAVNHAFQLADVTHGLVDLAVDVFCVGDALAQLLVHAV